MLPRYQRTKFHFCFTLQRQNFQCCNKRWNKVVRIRVAEKTWFFHKVWKNGFWFRYILSTLLSLYLLRTLLGHRLIQNRKLLWFWKVLLTCVLDTKRVQLVKESFPDFIYAPRIDFFYSFTASGSVLLQVECSVEKCVKIGTTKCFKDCIDVAYIKYINIVSQWSDKIVLFLNTSSSNFFENVAIHNIDIIQQNAESLQIFNKKNIVQIDYSELTGTQSIHFIDE